MVEDPVGKRKMGRQRKREKITSRSSANLLKRNAPIPKGKRKRLLKSPGSRYWSNLEKYE